MNQQPLIDASDLASQVPAAGCVVLDCRFELSAPNRGFATYLGGHIPGARYAHLDKDLAGPVTLDSGRHPLPTPEQFAACLGSWGVTPETFVVAYDDSGGAIAARLWWMLRWFGHRKAAILNGGVGAWTVAGQPLETAIPVWGETAYPTPGVKHDWVATTGEVETRISHSQGVLLLDARAAARFRGEVEPIDAVAGHVPGAANLPFGQFLGADGRFLPREQIAAVFAAKLPAETDFTNAIAMCGSGVTACHLLLAMEIAGIGTGRLYVGSWSEWIRDPARPTAIGDAAV
jgi:thiosulfate/3-mercaptopyruvate sulfurtransferase